MLILAKKRGKLMLHGKLLSFVFQNLDVKSNQDRLAQIALLWGDQGTIYTSYYVHISPIQPIL